MSELCEANCPRRNRKRSNTRQSAPTVSGLVPGLACQGHKHGLRLDVVSAERGIQRSTKSAETEPRSADLAGLGVPPLSSRIDLDGWPRFPRPDSKEEVRRHNP